MPSLKDMLSVKSMSGFAPAENAPKISPPTVMSGANPGINPYRRCPLPPFSATPDTLRQFDETGKVPARRVIPLPFQTAGSGGGVTNNITNVTSTGGGGGGSTTSLASASVAFSVPALSPGQAYTATVQIAKSFQLLLLTVSNPVNVRLYGTALAQIIDVSRLTDTAPPFEVTSGLITDIAFDTSPFQWSWQNRIAANADAPQSKTVYITVINYGLTGLGATTGSLTFLPLES